MIPARYEASRFPGKLMQMLGDKTVIRRVYEAAKNTNLFEEVVVVTDSDIIEKEIEAVGGFVIRLYVPLYQEQPGTGSAEKEVRGFCSPRKSSGTVNCSKKRQQ